MPDYFMACKLLDYFFKSTKMSLIGVLEFDDIASCGLRVSV